MAEIREQPDKSDHTRFYIRAGILILVVVLVFVVLMTKPWTHFRVKHGDSEFEIINKEQQGLSEEIARRILDQTDKNTDLQKNVSDLERENARLKQQQLIASAVQRIANKADRGDDRARAAIEEARISGDTEKLLGELRLLADQHNVSIGDDKAEYIQLCREIAELAYLRDDLVEAQRRLDDILKNNPDDLDAINRQGHIYKRLGKLDQAEKAYLKVGDLAGDDLIAQAISYGNLGIIHLKRGELDQGENMIRRAHVIFEMLEHDKGLASVFGNLGKIYHMRGELDQAETMLSKALEINESLGRLRGSAIAYKQLGDIAMKRGNFSEARKLWTQSRDLCIKMGNGRMVNKMQASIDGLPDDRKK